MNYLLDTHTFLWTISSTGNLSKKAQEVIKNPKNEIKNYTTPSINCPIDIRTR